MRGNASSVSPNRRADARAIIRFRDRSSLPPHFRLLAIYHKEEAKRRLNRIGGGSQKDLFSLYVVVPLHDGYNIRDNCPENAPKGSASEKSRHRKRRSRCREKWISPLPLTHRARLYVPARSQPATRASSPRGVCHDSPPPGIRWKRLAFLTSILILPTRNVFMAYSFSLNIYGLVIGFR